MPKTDSDMPKPASHVRIASCGWIVATLVLWSALCVLIFMPLVDWWLPLANTLAVLAILAAVLHRYRSWTAWAMASAVCLPLAQATWTSEVVAVPLFVGVALAVWLGFGVGVVWLLYHLGRTMFPGTERPALVGRRGQWVLSVTAVAYVALDCALGPLLMPLGIVVSVRPPLPVWTLLVVAAFALLLATTLFRFNRREMNRLSWFPVLMAMLTVFGGHTWWWLLRALE